LAEKRWFALRISKQGYQYYRQPPQQCYWQCWFVVIYRLRYYMIVNVWHVMKSWWIVTAQVQKQKKRTKNRNQVAQQKQLW